jgi:hypothetical protein
MDEVIVMELIDKKIAVLTTIATTSMLWWVSATVFCATLLGGIWRYKDQVQTAPFRKHLGFLLYFFYGSVVLYGFVVTAMTLIEFLDVRMLLSMIGAPASLFDAEFLWILLGMPIGTSSFVIFLLVWHHMWRSFGTEARAEALPPVLAAGAVK